MFLVVSVIVTHLRYGCGVLALVSHVVKVSEEY